MMGDLHRSVFSKQWLQENALTLIGADVVVNDEHDLRVNDTVRYAVLGVRLTRYDKFICYDLINCL